MSKQQKIAEYSKAAQVADEDQPTATPADGDGHDNDSAQPAENQEQDLVMQLQEELEQAKKDAKDNYDKMLRAMAELDNFKKRTSRETQDLRKYANESILKELLHTIDNLERAVDSAASDSASDRQLVEGVDLTLKEMFKILEKNGVSAVDALEQPFDPNFHEAMMQETSDLYPDNTVIKQLQKGYTFHDRLLRPAMVIVSKRTTPEPENLESPSDTADGDQGQQTGENQAN